MAVQCCPVDSVFEYDRVRETSHSIHKTALNIAQKASIPTLRTC